MGGRETSAIIFWGRVPGVREGGGGGGKEEVLYITPDSKATLGAVNFINILSDWSGCG